MCKCASHDWETLRPIGVHRAGGDAIELRNTECGMTLEREIEGELPNESDLNAERDRLQAEINEAIEIEAGKLIARMYRVRL